MQTESSSQLEEHHMRDYFMHSNIYKQFMQERSMEMQENYEYQQVQKNLAQMRGTLHDIQEEYNDLQVDLQNQHR